MTRSIRRSGHVLSQDDGEETVLLDLASERYYGLNRVGTRVWRLLDTHSSFQQLRGVLCAEFDAPPEQIERDLLALLEQLKSVRLIEVE